MDLRCWLRARPASRPDVSSSWRRDERRGNQARATRAQPRERWPCRRRRWPPDWRRATPRRRHGAWPHVRTCRQPIDCSADVPDHRPERARRSAQSCRDRASRARAPSRPLPARRSAKSAHSSFDRPSMCTNTMPGAGARCDSYNIPASVVPSGAVKPTGRPAARSGASIGSTIASATIANQAQRTSPLDVTPTPASTRADNREPPAASRRTALG